MGRPANYERVKAMTPEQQEHYPVNARLRRAHGARPEEYGNDVLGWHHREHPRCPDLA